MTALLVAASALAAANAQSGPATPDALIEEWHQSWTLNADGGIVYHERKRVKLNNDRAFGGFTDPRITFNSDTDTVEVIAARVRTPGGQVIDTPAYSRNEVAPSGPSGWPAFANLRQIVLTLSGIEPGCVAELEYKITTKATPHSVVAADLRLNHEYPIALRTVRVDIPVDAHFAPVVAGLPENAYTYSATSGSGGDGTLSHRWEFIGLPPAIDEPHSPPWQVRSPRLSFSTLDAETWSRSRLERIAESAEHTSEQIKTAAKKWAADATGREATVRAIQRKLADTFNFVDFNTAWRPAALRSAEAVFASGYGLPEEAAAVFLALLRAAGVEARPAFLRSDEVWCADAPQDAFIAAYVVDVNESAGVDAWHPQLGRIERDARWARHVGVMLNASDAGDALHLWPLPGFEPADSQIELAMRIKLAADGTYAGTASFTISGLFIPADGLSDAERQKERVRSLIRRILPQARIDSLDATRVVPGALSGAPTPTFTGTAKIASDAPLDKTTDRFALVLAQDGPHTATIGWPLLGRTRRETPLRLPAAFAERINLSIEWPEAWKLDARPGDPIEASGDWGSVKQSTAVDGHTMTLKREVRLNAADITPAAFVAIRDVLNQLRSESERTILLKP